MSMERFVVADDDLDNTCFHADLVQTVADVLNGGSYDLEADIEEWLEVAGGVVMALIDAGAICWDPETYEFR